MERAFVAHLERIPHMPMLDTPDGPMVNVRLATTLSERIVAKAAQTAMVSLARAATTVDALMSDLPGSASPKQQERHEVLRPLWQHPEVRQALGELGMACTWTALGYGCPWGSACTRAAYHAAGALPQGRTLVTILLGLAGEKWTLVMAGST